MNISRNHNKGPKHKHWDLTSKPVLEPDEMTASKIHTKGPQSLTNLSPALTTSEAAPHGALDQGRGCKGKVEVTKGLISSFHSEFITANVKKKNQKKYAQGYRTQQSCSGRQQHSVHKGRQSGSFPKLSCVSLSQNACFALFQQVRAVGSPFPTRAPFPCSDGSATTALPSLGFGLYLLSRNCPSTDVLAVTISLFLMLSKHPAF